jgi:XRE family transcriptional regulator, regulator of sulfur utilization
MLNRREVLSSLAAIALLGLHAEAESGPPSPSVISVFKSASMPISRNPFGAAGWGVPSTLLPQGELLEVHVTTLEPGKDFAPMRLNPNSSFRLIQSGKMEVLPQGLPSLTAESGDVVFAPANLTYQVRNSGDTPLTYFVIQIKPRPVNPAS